LEDFRRQDIGVACEFPSLSHNKPHQRRRRSCPCRFSIEAPGPTLDIGMFFMKTGHNIVDSCDAPARMLEFLPRISCMRYSMHKMWSVVVFFFTKCQSHNLRRVPTLVSMNLLNEKFPKISDFKRSARVSDRDTHVVTLRDLMSQRRWE
jgi:hypothetical protein